MKILCTVDQVECIRRGIDAPTPMVQIDVIPANLTEGQRHFIAGNLKNGYRFTGSLIVPPTYEGLIDAVQRKLA
jgi:hypothetical protein